MKAVVICNNDFPWGVVLNPTKEKVNVAKAKCRVYWDTQCNCNTDPQHPFSTEDYSNGRRTVYIHTHEVEVFE